METRPIASEAIEVFLVVVEEGSFSAAASRLGRSQPAVSYAIRGLEESLGVTLFDRRGRLPRLTDHGLVLVEDARRALFAVGALAGRARRLSEGVEARVRLAVDQLFDFSRVRAALKAFSARWPEVALELRSEGLGAVVQLVEEGACDFGIAVDLAVEGRALQRVPFGTVRMVPVCAPGHPLAACAGSIGPDELAATVQLVTTDRTERTRGRSAGIVSARTWRFADLHSKHLCLLDGFGWGNLPEHLADPDVEAGRLVVLDLAVPAPAAGLFVVHRAGRPPGPAGSWLLDSLGPLAS